MDCLLIGYNEMNFPGYEENLRQMGVDSGAYRDLNLNFIRYNNRPYTVPGIFNLFCGQNKSENKTCKQVTQGDMFNAAVAYLGTYLHNRGFTFDYVNAFQDDKEELVEKLSRQDIKAIAIITTLYVSVLPIVEIIGCIKTHNRTAKIIVGGPFVSTQVRLQSSGALEYLFDTTIGADIYVNSSQGETALVNILNALKQGLPLERVDNIYYKPGPGSPFVATASLKEDNKLAENSVDWNLFTPHLGEFIPVRTSISCPFSCAFCGFPQHAGKYQTLPVELIKKELDQLDKPGTVKLINFIDDTLNVPVKRFKEILRMMIKSQYRFRWFSYFRCQYADREMISLMKESGCEGVFLGLESGNDRILENMNKLTKKNEYLRGIELLKQAGIITFGSFLIGFPGETQETVQDTVRFIKESGLDFYRCQLWYCEPITPVWKQKNHYELKGENFQWSHATMDSKNASDLIDEMFLTINNPVAVPQYHFDFCGIWQMVYRGMSITRVKQFLENFNRGIREKLLQPSSKEISYEVVKGLKNTCSGLAGWDDLLDEKDHKVDIGKYNVAFDF